MSVISVHAPAAPLDTKSLVPVENDVERNRANVTAIVDALVAANPGVQPDLASTNLVNTLQDWPSFTTGDMKLYSCVWYMGISISCPGIKRAFLGSVEGAPITAGGEVSGSLFYKYAIDLQGPCTFQASSTSTTMTVAFYRGPYLFARYIAKGISPMGSTDLSVYSGKGKWQLIMI